MTPQRNDNDHGGNDRNDNQEYDNDEQQQPPPPPFEPAYRTSSPPIPALKNKGKKPKSNANNVRRPSVDDVRQQQSPPPFYNNDDFAQLPPIDDNESQGRQTYRKPPTPRQPGMFRAFNKLYVVCMCLLM
jgi:hypothetical protein